MPLTTTVIGSFPKPEYLQIPDWFKTDTNTGKETAAFSEMLSNQSEKEAKEMEAKDRVGVRRRR